jgi:DNA-binding winged helix-turn-helix (wHTH) protein/TolB-like protein
MPSGDHRNALRIGHWELIPDLNLLRREGLETRLEPRHVDLLVFLAGRAGEVVSADEILSGVWSGLVVGDHSVYQAIAKLRKALGDDASQATYIETVPKRGYRLIAEVSLPDRPGEPAPPGVEPPGAVRAPQPWRGMPLRWAALALLLAALGVAALWLSPEDAPSEAGDALPSLAVLPFTSLSEQTSDRFIAEGFAIELAGLLGETHDLRVLGPISAKLAAQTDLDLAEIGRRLDADLIVSGSLRRSAELLRISATVTDARTGYQRWSRIIERPDGDIFHIQREIAAEIAEALRATLDAAQPEPRLTASPSTRAAYDDFLLGQYHRRIRSPSSLRRALDLFRRALTLNPRLAGAKRDLASTYLLLSFYGDMPLREALAQAEPLLRECLIETPDDGELLAVIGLSHHLNGSHGLAEDYLRRAVSRVPNQAEAWMWLGLAERQQGRLRDAIVAFRHAHDLEPLMVTANANLANALTWSGQPVAGEALLKKLVRTLKDHPQPYRTLSSIALESGDLAGAHQWARTALALDPSDPVSRVGMALTLAYLGQDAQALALVADIRTTAEHGRLVQSYLDRMTLILPGLPPPDLGGLYEARLTDSPGVQEIEWRLANARIGLASAFSGNLSDARERLGKSLAGRVDPIERTDYDLFLCTSLVDVLRRLAEGKEAERWLARCRGDSEEAVRRGWDSLALAYVRARLVLLEGSREQALTALDAAVAKGLRNATLLRLDPVFEPLRDQQKFAAVLSRIDTAVQQQWRAVTAAHEGCDPTGAPCEAPRPERHRDTAGPREESFEGRGSPSPSDAMPAAEPQRPKEAERPASQGLPTQSGAPSPAE